MSDWERAEEVVLNLDRASLNRFSPVSTSVPEIETEKDLWLLRRIFSNTALFADRESLAQKAKYNREFDMTNARRKGLFSPFEGFVKQGCKAIDYGLWSSDNKLLVCFYTGKMVEQYDFAYQKWLSGRGNHAKWGVQPFNEKEWLPEYVMPISNVAHRWRGGTRLVFRDVTNATNERTAIAAIIPAWPCGNKVPVIAEDGEMPVWEQLGLCAVMNSFVYDYVVRQRMTGINLNKFILTETPVPQKDSLPKELSLLAARLTLCHEVFAGAWLDLGKYVPGLKEHSWRFWWALTPADRLRVRAMTEAVVAASYGLDEDSFRWILRDCDHPRAALEGKAFRKTLNPKGFWRVGIGDATNDWRKAWNCEPEIRLTVLSQVAFSHLTRCIEQTGGDKAEAIRRFVGTSQRTGWQIPTPLVLKQYGLGYDERASRPQEINGILQTEVAKHPEVVNKGWEECETIARRLEMAWSMASGHAEWLVPQEVEYQKAAEQVKLWEEEEKE